VRGFLPKAITTHAIDQQFFSSTTNVSEATVTNLDPTKMAFSCDDLGTLIATANGQRYVSLSAMRLFPMTDPDNWIAIFDHSGKELCCIPSLASLSSESAEAVRKTLAGSEFIPVIERVVHISSNDPPCRWLVETNRGTTEFIINDEKDLRRLSEFKVLIVDARGVRYSVPDVRKLNTYGRRAIEWHV
jgi:Domain of unknown function (DUF1854)